MSEINSSPHRVLDGYSMKRTGVPSKEAIESYNRDGVVCLRGAFDQQWIDQGRIAIAAALRTRSRSPQYFSHREPGETGKFYFDTFLWKRLPSFRRFTFESPAASIARQIMQTHGLLLYFDMAIVKEPGASATTPWHYDEAYWPVSGSQVCNIWIAMDHVPEETALRFVLGSHRLGTDYRAVDFFTKEKKKSHIRPAPPDWDNSPGKHQIVSVPMEPGDCAVFNFKTHHSAPGNSHHQRRRRAICTHWLGDDARYDNKSWECSPNERGENLVHGGSLQCATFPRVY